MRLFILKQKSPYRRANGVRQFCSIQIILIITN
nr:MAG TPA: hypothetical protein [Caudoviricetes sp.]